MVTLADILDEERRLRQVRLIVHFTSSVIMQSGLKRSEAEALVAAARARILDLFPGRDETYELLYARRFERLLEEFTTPDRADRPPVVIPFPGALSS